MKQRFKGETIKQWLKRVSIVDDTWIKKAKKRKRYKFYYDFVFWLKLKYSKTKKIQKNNIIKIMRLDEELGLYKNQNK